jgi:hypothetical protein
LTEAQMMLSKNDLDNSSIVPVFEDRIFAIGGAVPADMPLSLFPRGMKGWLPLQCYALRDGNNFLLLDTGVTLFKKEIGAAIARISEGSTRRTLLLTRREHDAAVNLPWIVSDFAFHLVMAGGDLNPLDFFATMDDASAFAQLRATSGIDVKFVKAGSIVEVGLLRMEALPVVLRVLTTQWYHEHTSKTLFTSDSFGFVTTASKSGPTKISPDKHAISAAEIKKYLGAKFDWICGIDTKPLIKDLVDVVGGRDIERVCACSGAIIEGKEAVAYLFEQTVVALEELAREPRKSVMAGFDYSRIAV